MQYHVSLNHHLDCHSCILYLPFPWRRWPECRARPSNHAQCWRRHFSPPLTHDAAGALGAPKSESQSWELTFEDTYRVLPEPQSVAITGWDVETILSFYLLKEFRTIGLYFSEIIRRHNEVIMSKMTDILLYSSRLPKTGVPSEETVASIHPTHAVRNESCFLVCIFCFNLEMMLCGWQDLNIELAQLELRRIRTVHQYLFVDAAQTLISAFVLSTISYCHSALFGIPKYLLVRLKKKTKKKTLHVLSSNLQSITIFSSSSLTVWLPIAKRID